MMPLSNESIVDYNTCMQINVKHIAKLANLTLSEKEIIIFEKQLEETLMYVENLSQIDTTNVTPTNQVTELENVTREDKVAPSLSQVEALKNSKSVYNGFIKVKAVLGE